MCYLCYNYLENLEVRRAIAHVALQVILAVQGDPNQNLKCHLAITLKLCISDPMLAKPKWVLEAYNFFEKL